MLPVITGFASILFYLLPTLILWRELTSGHTQHSQYFLPFSLTGLVLHAALLFQALPSDAGINIGFFNALSMAAWATTALLVITMSFRPVINLAIIIYPIDIAVIILSLVLTSEHVIPLGTNAGLSTHIILAIFAYGLLSIAALQAIVVAYQDRQLRLHRPGGLIKRLPPLQTMESIHFQLITMGFITLSLAIIVGVLFLEDMFAQHLAHKTILTIIAWCIFAILLLGRWRFGWRGQKAIRWSLSGFAILVLAFFGSKLVLELLLHR